MTATTATSVLVSHRDGSFWATPEADLGASLLNGMIEAAQWVGRTQPGNVVAWDEITPAFVKGHVLATGERLVVMAGSLPMATEDELTEWIFANDDK